MTPQSGPHQFVLLDTRSIWPGKTIDEAVSIKTLVMTKRLLKMHKAAGTLRHLSIDEQEKARKFHFLKDAKLSVASSLLKRFFVNTAADVRWQDITFYRTGDAKHGKPSYRLPGDTEPYLDFNVSHQAGVVVGGCTTSGALLGVDIVCTNERNHAKMIDLEGFEAWIDMHADVFSAEDVAQMKTGKAPDMAGNELDSKLRNFYAFWALKEAYVKLEGEALLAPWLKDVEFRNVKCPPLPAKSVDGSPSIFGDLVPDIEVWVYGDRRADVQMSLRSYEENYMIATAVKTPAGTSALEPVYRVLDVERDILATNSM